MSRTATVAHVVLSLDPGGTEKLVLDLAARCSRSSATRVFCLDRAGEWAPQLTDMGVPVDVVGRRPGFDWTVAWRLRRLSGAHRVDVLHCHQYSPFVYGAMAAVTRPGLRVVFTEHGRLSGAAPSRRRTVVNRVLAPIPSVITAVSQELREFMIAEGFPAHRVEVVHNGIDAGVEPTPEARDLARMNLGVTEGDFVVGTAARLDPVKNLGMALDACAALRARVPNAILVVIGDGPERDMLLDRAGQHDGKAIRWLGYRQDVRALLPGMDVYLNTSISEGVSVTILEAMAAGIPVVATAVGGTPEVVAPDVTGLLIGNGDASGCARALERLARDRGLRARFGQAGRERMKAHFGVDQMVSRYMTAYGAR